MKERTTLQLEGLAPLRVDALRARLMPHVVRRVVRRAQEAAQGEVRGAVGALQVSFHLSASETERVTRRARALERAWGRTKSTTERQALLLAHIDETVAAGRARRRDRAAVSGSLDLEALLDREAKRIHLAAQEALVAGDLLGQIAGGTDDLHALRPAVERAITVADGDLRLDLREVALRLVTAWLRRRPAAAVELARRAIARLDRLYRRRNQPIWVRARALEGLAAGDPMLAAERLATVLRDREPGRDGLVLRHHGLQLVPGELPPSDLLLELAHNDPSPCVRQECARAAARSGRLALARQMVLEDAEPAVQLAALDALVLAGSDEQTRDTVTTLAEPDRDHRVVIAALELMAGLRPWSWPSGQLDRLVARLERLVSEHRSPQVAERAAATLRSLQVGADPPAAEAAARLRRELGRLREGQRCRFAVAPQLHDDQVFAAVLREAARDDLAVSARRIVGGYELQRGERRGRRLWRLLHELTHRLPDKRQGFSHSTARRMGFDLSCPPVQMAELTPTAVPGERRYQSVVGGWAPFLPLVDDLLAACCSGRPRRLITSAGIVTIHPPGQLLARLRVWLRLVFGYARLAERRERALAAGEPRDQAQYADEVRRLGFRLELGETGGTVGSRRFEVRLPAARATLAHYAFGAPLVGDPLLRYLFAPEGNTPAHLVVIVVALLVALLVRGAVLRNDIRRALNAIPLTIGGWGTRGKSGTERLKAAVLQAAGYEVLVKTTGCEAMFIHGLPGRTAREIFLHRPYGKATIWEHRDVLRLAARFGVQAFLWECMALRPRFVDLLAHHWMRGKLATITNAYPDHEDQMGPSGEDVARVIARFVPRHGHLLTSEVQMLPLLRQQAADSGSELTAVSPGQIDRIAPDLLARFPYQEHPANIALVAALAAHLGLDPHRAIVDMADHVVPDVGVLRTYPEVPYRGRRVVFSNGMSANERAGCLANWERLGLRNLDLDGSERIVTIVNNREDRLARSRVFARLIVRDIASDAHVCVGTNVKGLRRMIDEALEVWLSEQRVVEDDARWSVELADAAVERFDKKLRNLRIGSLDPTRFAARVARCVASVLPVEAQQLAEKLDQRFVPREVRAVLAGRLARRPAAERIAAWYRLGMDLDRLCAERGFVEQVRAAIQQASDAAAANATFRRAYRRLFWARVVFVDDPDASADQVIDTAVRCVPCGERAHLVGLQNIKGVGLDLVYRWIAVEQVAAWLHKVATAPDQGADAIRQMSEHPDYGLLDSRLALDGLRRGEFHLKDLLPDVLQVERQLKTVLKCQHKTVRGGPPRASLVLKPARIAVRWLDPLEAVYRRWRAHRVLEALVAGRMGHARAAVAMREIAARDDGGRRSATKAPPAGKSQRTTGDTVHREAPAGGSKTAVPAWIETVSGTRTFSCR